MEIVFLILLVLLMAWALASGYPVAFALPGSAIATVLLAAAAGYLFAGNTSAYFFQSGPIAWLTAGVTNFRGIYWEPERDTLIAIPLFVFMGITLQRSKIAEDLLMTMARLFGPVPGGLGISVVFVGALLAATTGILGATVVAMGLISLPAMMRNKYSIPLSTGTIAASGALGQIIPPSIVLIILADQLSSAVDQASAGRQELYRNATGESSMPSEFAISSTSAGDMFMGAMVPGLILVVLYMLYILAVALIRPSAAPAVHRDGRLGLRAVAQMLTMLLPPLVLIFAVLGSIILGIATVTQAGAIGAAGAMIMASYRLKDGQRGAFHPAILAIAALIALVVIKEMFSVNVKAINTEEDARGVLLAGIAVAAFLVALAWSGWRMLRINDTLRSVMVETAKTTSLVFIILIGAAMLTAAFRAFGGEELVREFLITLPGGFWSQFAVVMLVIFILGFFLDFIEIAVVVVPIVAPILLIDPSANITAVWLGVMIGVNIQTSFLSPPFGFALFYLRGVASAAVKTVQIYKGVIPFIALQLVALVIVGLMPSLVNYLPTRISLTSETAPPPVNPRLQYCMEEYVFEQFDGRGEQIRAVIARVRALPLDILPSDVRSDLNESLDKSEQVEGLLAGIRTAEAAVQEQVPTYRPLHREVRALERQIRLIERNIGTTRTQLQRVAADDEARRETLQARLAELEADSDSLLAGIPADWEAKHDAFLKLVRAEETARQLYRRTTDQAYRPLAEALSLLQATDGFLALQPQFEALQTAVEAQDKAAEELASTLLMALRETDAEDPVTDGVSDVRREIRKDAPDWAATQQLLADSLEAYAAESAWRQEAVSRLLPDVEAYEAEIRDTIGLRQQPRLPDDVALYVAACNADHRDVSLSF